MTAPLAHGGRLGDAENLFPGAKKPWVDLSTGINPVPYPVPPLDAACFTRLPEPHTEAALREAAARAYGATDASLVAAAPGTQILIDILPVLYPAARVAVLGPTYAEYAQAWRRAGARVTTVAALSELDGADVAIVCNPNNPDGRRLLPWALVALADRLAATAVRLDRETADLGALIAAAGLRVVGGTRLFRLAEGENAQAIFARLGRAGIFVRRFAEQPHRLRFGVPGTPEAWARLSSAAHP